MARNSILTSPNLSKEELTQLYQVSRDPFLFSTFIKVVNPVHGVVKFDLYPYQRAVLYQFLKERFNIILKFRQAGITELISLYCLWLCLYHPNKKVNIISIKDTVAKKVLKKIKFMYKNLPSHLQTPIINGRVGEYGSATSMEFSNGSLIESIPTSENAGRSESLTLLVIDEAAAVRWAASIWASALPTLSCITGSTKLLLRKREGSRYEYQKKSIKEISPSSKGILDLHLEGYETLTHTGSWQKILYSQNKGLLETWSVLDTRGKKLRATPKHRLLTTQGWKTLREIIEDSLTVIQVDTQVETLKIPPRIKPPQVEEIRVIEGFPGYYVSNLGKVYKNTSRGFTPLKPRANKDGYLRVWLKTGERRKTSKRSKEFPRSIHKLVAEAFLGEKPKGYQVDHLDCNRTHNFITNLRYVTPSKNVKRSKIYSLSGLLSTITGSRLPELVKRGRILELAKDGFSPREIAKEVYPEARQGYKFVKRILSERKGRVYISQLSLIKRTYRTIYDIHVANDESYITANGYVNHNTGGSAIVNSTPLGLGGFYHSTWVDALSHSNGFNPIRLYWRMHPERDDAWYQQMAAALGPKKTAQEIDGDFLSSGNTVFDPADIRAIEECLSEYPVLKSRFSGQYKEFNEVDPNKEYFIGADCATGRATDYSSFTCMDRDGEEVAIYKGRIPLDQYAKLLGDTGEKFNFALLAPETNDIGAAVTSMLQTEGYPNLYHYQKLLRKKGHSKPDVELVPGWLTTTKNRSVIIEGLETDIRNDDVIIKDPFFVQEAYTFIYQAGRPVAMGKHRANTSSVDIDLEGETYSDDDIFGKAICNHIRKNSRQNTIVLPK